MLDPAGEHAAKKLARPVPETRVGYEGHCNCNAKKGRRGEKVEQRGEQVDFVE